MPQAAKYAASQEDTLRLASFSSRGPALCPHHPKQGRGPREPPRRDEPTLTKISGQFSSSSYAAMSRLQANTDTRLFPLALKLMEASRRRRLHRAYERQHVIRKAVPCTQGRAGKLLEKRIGVGGDGT